MYSFNNVTELHDLNENMRQENRRNVYVENSLKLIEIAWDYHTQS